MKENDLSLETALLSMTERLNVYGRTEIPSAISPADDMFVAGDADHYWRVGHSAIEIIANAMILAGKHEVCSVLDLPCGGARVTRHLRAFFPQAKLFVGDLDKAKESFSADLVGADIINPRQDFSAPSPLKFDLIFVGSLLTHFSAELCEMAMAWFIEALQPDGLLVVTFHGRRTLAASPLVRDSTDWEYHRNQYHTEGFSFRPDDTSETSNPLAYGLSLSKPSWVMSLVERTPSARIIGYRESVWDNNHDVLIVQKRPI